MSAGDVQTTTLPEPLPRAQRVCAFGGAAALGLCALGGLLWHHAFFQAYLIGYMLALGVTLGGMGILMLHHLTGGAWGVPLRRILEAMTRNVPLMTLLFLPLLLGLHSLYEWTHADQVAKDPVLQHKQAYLNERFFIIRAVVYFAIWNVLAFLLNRGSRELDRTRSAETARRLQLICGPGILLYVLSMSFASFDWMMSLEPHWFSTIYGMLLVVGQALSAFAAVTILLARLAPHRPMSNVAAAGHFHDVGNLTLAFVMLWAYMSLSQFLIIWSGNTAEEVPWYVTRTNHGWGAVAVLLILFHFAVPFVLLLSRGIKRDPRRLSRLAGLILFMRAVDLFWLIAPAHSQHFHLSWMDVLAPVGLGGIWVAAVIWQLGRRPLIPAGLPEHGQERLAAEST